MKKIIKGILGIVSLIMILAINSNIASAETKNEGSLKVKFDIEQLEKGENTIKGKIKITNIGIRKVKEINLESILPEGLEIKDGESLSKNIGEMDPGEIVTHEFVGIVEKKLKPLEPTNPEVDGNEGDKIPVEEGGLDESEDINISGEDINTGDEDTIAIYIGIIGVLSIFLKILSNKSNKDKRKDISILLCLIISFSIVQEAVVVRAEENNKISVNEKIVIDEVEYKIETIITYKNENEVRPGGHLIKRGEWIAKLLKASNIKNISEVDGNMNHGLTDIQGHQFEKEIIYAKMYGASDIEEGNFNPDDIATREFSIMTAVKILGFEAVKDIVCNDVNEIKFPKEVDLGVDLELINLENNKFYPNRELTENESNYILEGIKELINSTEVNENYDNIIEYKENVIIFRKDEKYEVDGTVVTFEINSKTEKLEKDRIFVLPGEKPYKVSSIKKEGNKIFVSTVVPEIEKTLNYLDVQGVGKIDINKFIPADGVEVVQNQRIDVDGEIGIPGTLNLKIDKKLSEKIKLTGDVAFGIPKVSYKADIDFGFLDVDINNVFLKVQQNTKLTGQVAVKGEGSSETKGGFFKVGKVPVVGIPGVGIYVEIGIAYSLEGRLKVVYSVEGAIGAQVLNNRFRSIKDLKSSLDIPVLEVNGKVGPKISGLLEVCNTWKLLDFSVGTGIGINATAQLQGCLNATGYWYLDISALDESLLGNLLNLKYNCDLFNKDNSPLRKSYHFEEFNKVPICTVGDGVIKGTVAEASDRSKFIKDARIQIYNADDNRLVEETKSDVDGRYNIEVRAGKYIVKISKENYITFESRESLATDEEKNIETYLMVGQGSDGEKGIAGGKITDALTGSPIKEVNIKVRKGWNNISGEVEKTTTTDITGLYKVELPLGNYSVEMSKEGYTTGNYNIYVKEGTAMNQNNTLIPNDEGSMVGDLRVVLTWGEKPRDLDSHLVGPTKDGDSNFHIYYGNKSYSEEGVEYTNLDLDDTSAYGPETTTIYKMNEDGKYSFYVHDFTNKTNPNSTDMSNSGAQVNVYRGNKLLAKYVIQTNTAGVYWKVFDYDAKTNKISSVNQFVDEITYEEDMKKNKKIEWDMGEKGE